MKLLRNLLLGAVLSFCALPGHAAIPVIPDNMPFPLPTYGFNLGNSYEAIWGYSYPSQAVFTTAVSEGFNAVRVSCVWDTHANQITYAIDPTYMAHVKQAVNFAIGQGFYVMINVHTQLRMRLPSSAYALVSKTPKNVLSQQAFD